MKHSKELERTGISGPSAGTELWQRLVNSPSGAVVGESSYEDAFDRIPHPEGKLQLVMRELLDELEELKKLEPLVDTSEDYPFALVGRCASGLHGELCDSRSALDEGQGSHCADHAS